MARKPREPSQDADGNVLDLRQLRHFLAIVETGHFGRAAQQLGISKQGISNSVAALEESLGARLFERGQFGAVATEFGIVLTQHAKLILSEIRKARLEINGLCAEHRGEVTFAVGSSFSEFIAPQAIMRFREAHPRVVLKIAHVHPDSMLQLLSQGELDFVAMGDLRNADLADLSRRPLFRMSSNLLMAATHPLARASNLSIADLVDSIFVGVWRHDLTERTVLSAFARHGLAAPSMIDCDNFLVTRGLVLDEGCLVIANRLFFERELANGSIVERVIPDLTYDIAYAMFHRKETVLGRATVALMDQLRQAAVERFSEYITLTGGSSHVEL